MAEGMNVYAMHEEMVQRPQTYFGKNYQECMNNNTCTRTMHGECIQCIALGDMCSMQTNQICMPSINIQQIINISHILL